MIPKKLLVFSIFFLFIALSINAQKAEERFATSADIFQDTSSKKISSNSCSKIASYIPDTLNRYLTPMRTVRINFHVIQDGKGENNFNEVEGRKFLHHMIENANQRLANNAKMHLPKDNATAVIPIPYRYVLTGDKNNPSDDGIYFHKNDTLFAMNKKSKKKDNVYDRRQYDTYGVQKQKVINIFLIEHYPDSIASTTYKASSDGVGTGSWVKLVGSYNLWKHPTITAKGDTMYFGSWNVAGLMNHELGHCFGLSHTWNTDDGCDDTPKSPGCWNFGPPPCEICSNNVMDYNAFTNALTPCQIGKACMNFLRDKGARDYLVPDWCLYTKEKSITISEGSQTQWNGSVDVFGDLIIENNATLTISCIVSMPPGSRIILSPKATLILNGCTITSRCENGQWDGIVIKSTRRSQPNIISKYKTKLEKAVHPI
jgi:hypothetical protein